MNETNTFDIIYQCVLVFVGSMFKFVAGPITGSALGLPIYLTIIFTFLGMMCSVTIGTFFGPWLKKYVFQKICKSQKKFSKRTRQAVTIWKKYGMLGVSILTPLFFTPLGGTLIVVAFGETKSRIYSYMLPSAAIFAVLISVLFYYFRSLIPI
jgi:membrane protein DedA with SNARE-associated domain